jgi:hypothetical protein
LEQSGIMIARLEFWEDNLPSLPTEAQQHLHIMLSLST